jgi:hypothetical protein
VAVEKLGKGMRIEKKFSEEIWIIEMLQTFQTSDFTAFVTGTERSKGPRIAGKDDGLLDTRVRI